MALSPIEISPIEAIAFYEFSKRKQRNGIGSSPFTMVIIHTDDYSVGFCTCDNNGNIEIKERRSLTAAASCMKELDTGFQRASGRDAKIADSVGPFIDSFNSKMKAFYRTERGRNSDFKDDLGFDFDCNAFDEVFGTARDRFEELLSEIDDLWSKTGFDEDDTSIIIAGEAALYYPVVYAIKEFFTFDPFMTDERFVSDGYQDKADEIVRIGTEEYNRKKEQESSIFLLAVDRNGENQKIMLPFAADASQKMQFAGPVFVSRNDRIEIEYKSASKTIKLPFLADPLDGDVIEIGACMIGGKPTIRIRDCENKNKIYDIPIA